MKRSKLLMASMSIAAAAAVVGGLGAVGTGSAFAGTNGQQIAFCQNESTDFTNVTVNGMGQDGRGIAQNFETGRGRCILTKDYWWKGIVSLTWNLSASDLDNDATSCEVPEQFAGDTFACVEQPTP